MSASTRLLAIGLFAGFQVLSFAAPAAAAGVDFSRYFKSSTALAAVTSAVSILEPCDTPIQYTEEVSKEMVVLTAKCPATGGESISVKISFQQDEEGNLFPDTFDYGN